MPHVTTTLLTAALAAGCLTPIPNTPLAFARFPASPNAPALDEFLPAMKALIEAERRSFEIVRLAVTHDDWHIVRHQFSGTPLARTVGARFILRVAAMPGCFYGEAVFSQGVELANVWGRLRLAYFYPMTAHEYQQTRQLGDGNATAQVVEGVQLGSIPCDAA
jgi:hypothetical protein